MTYGKITSVIGTLSNAPAAPDRNVDNGRALVAWCSANHRVYQLSGHWNPEKAAAFATKRGVTVSEIKHSTLDYSGKGRGGLDQKFVVVKGHIMAVNA